MLRIMKLLMTSKLIYAQHNVLVILWLERCVVHKLFIILFQSFYLGVSLSLSAITRARAFRTDDCDFHVIVAICLLTINYTLYSANTRLCFIYHLIHFTLHARGQRIISFMVVWFSVEIFSWKIFGNKLIKIACHLLF